MKRALVFLLAATLLTLSLVSCGKPDPVVKESVLDTDYSITYYWGPPLKDFNETAVVQMKEAGFDIIPLQRFPDNPDALKEAVQLIGKHGMSAAVTDSRITDLYGANKTFKQEAIDAVVTEVVSDYSGYDAIKEWIICDEPPMAKFNVLGKIVDAFRRIDPERKTFINVLPVYATAQMMGIDSYEKYIEGFCKIVKPDYICYDYYEFLGADATTGKRGAYFQNMEIIKAAAEKYNLEMRVIVLVTQHGEYSNVTPEEIAWQANTSLLYGMKGLSYFTYWQPEDPDFTWTNAMVDAGGNITQHYYDVQKENKITRVLGNALYDTSCDHVYKINAGSVTGVEEYTGNNSQLGSVSGEDFLLSEYQNGWFMLMNANTVKGNDRTLTIQKMEGNLFWLNVETQRWESIDSCSDVKEKSSGKYQITLPAARALLLRIETPPVIEK